MVKLFQSVIAALLVTGALALAGCADDTTSAGGTPGVFGTGGTTIGTGTGPAGQVVLVRLGTDNLVESDPPLYRKIWVAIVTDTAGRAVAGATVVFNLRSGTASNPGGFLKGRYFLPGLAPAPQVWTQVPSAACANEDANFNAILDAGEDINGNGLLEPPGVSDVNPVGMTDGSGVALATITYPKNYASWAQVTLEATTGGAGATPASATFFLVGAASDYTDLTVAPPGVFSPFGLSGNCADTL
jgi:hypothetical protein